MEWLFDTTTIVHTEENAIDAACMYSRYADGGFCVGIQFKGTTVRSPKLWANWVYMHQIDEFISNRELGGHDDLVDWHTDETGFLTTWTAYRWLPRYEFIKDYYYREYRFSPDVTDIKARAYWTTDATTFNLGTA